MTYAERKNVKELNAQVIKQLQTTFTTTEYETIIKEYTHSASGLFSLSQAGEGFRKLLPLYCLARCPFCNTASVERLNTHGLEGWKPYPDRYESVFDATPDKKDCRHFLAVQFFINLHDVVPQEMVYFSNQSEVPYVMPVFLSDDIESCAVMHSLPICRIEQDRFVPRYSLYTLTYYSKDVHAMWDRRRAEFKGGDGMHFPKLHTWRRARDTPEAWDLPLWVRKGKLLWLDLEQDTLPLKAGPVEAFPYGNIEGIRKSYTYRKGELKIDPY
jgi:hypothetical protein